MRRYDIISGILLILSIIDFALAAPVSVQEKRQVGIDMVHIPELPEDVITVLGKRMNDDYWANLLEFFKSSGKSIDSSDAHASSSSVPLGPEHGSTGVAQAPTPNPESSTANPGLLMEPSSTSSITPVPDSFENQPNYIEYNAQWDDKDSNAGSYGGSDNEWEWNEAAPNEGQRDPNFGSDHSANLDNNFNFWSNLDDAKPLQGQPNLGTSTVTGPDPNFDRLNLGDTKPLQGQPNPEIGLGIPSSDDAPSSRLTSTVDLNQEDPNPEGNLISAQSPPGPPPSTWSDISPGADLYPDPQLLMESSQPVDPAYLDAAIRYAMKGKAKQLRRVSGTARDLGKCGPLDEGVAAC